MTPIAHHAGEQLLLGAAIGTGVLSGSLVFLRAHVAVLARRLRRRRP